MLSEKGADILKFSLGGEMKPVSPIHPILFAKEIIHNHSTRIASDDEVINKVFMKDTNIFISFVSEKLRTITKR